MKRTPLLFAGLIAAALLLGSTSANAQARKAKYVPAKITATQQNTGWDPFLTLGANFSLASSNGVVGQIDGLALTVGAQIDGGINYLQGSHEWRNRLKVTEAFTLSPAVDQLVKSNDVFAIDSLYLFRLPSLRWLGPYLRVEMNTALLPGYDVRGAPVTYRIMAKDGSARDVTTDRLDLSDAFTPLTLKQSLGAFTKPVESSSFNMEIKLGLSGKQTFADGQLALDDDSATPQIEVKSLENAFQLGPSLGVDLIGKLVDNKLNYFVGAELMLPLLNNTDGQNSLDLLNVIVEAGLSIKVFAWMTLDYKLKALREPAIVDRFQVQNSLLLNFTYAVRKAEAKKLP